MIERFSCYQGQVMSLELAIELKKSIEALPRECFFLETSNGRWGLLSKQPPSHRYENPHDSWFVVSFGNDRGVIEEQITAPFSHYQNYETLKKTVCVALKWMAETMSWQGQTKQMAMSIMQHHSLYQGETTSAIPWHQDNSDHSLVILLDDETKWSEGHFLFQTDNQDLQTFQPKCGYGLLFSNDGTKHYVEPLTAKANGIDRTILTIHEKSTGLAGKLNA